MHATRFKYCNYKYDAKTVVIKNLKIKEFKAAFWMWCFSFYDAEKDL